MVAISLQFTLGLFLLSCQKNSSYSLPKPTTDFEECRETIIGFWNAFNSYDLEKCLSYYDPTVAEEKREIIHNELNRFEMGRVLGVKLIPTDFYEAVVMPNGELDIRYTLTIKPVGLSSDKYQKCVMVKVDGAWKIFKRMADPDKTPPQAPASLKLTIISVNQVDLTWEDNTTYETGYRVDRALDTGFKAELVSVILPPNSTFYSDTSTHGGLIYYYRVVVFSNAGDSSSQTYPARMPGS
jgi:hypothetical protein